MTARLVYSRPHICHGREMIWQPHARSWYCPTPRCHRREGVNEYAAEAPWQDPTEINIDQPEPETA